MLSQSLRPLSQRSTHAIFRRRLPALRNSCTIHTLPVQASSRSTPSSNARALQFKVDLTSTQCRMMSTPPPQINESHLSMEEYHTIADQTMDGLLETMEDMVETLGDDGHEVEYSSGVLTLKVGHHGTYVINKQPPNKQIWLSSPKSGPKRYDFDESSKSWVYSRDDKTLHGLLTEELSKIYGLPVEFFFIESLHSEEGMDDLATKNVDVDVALKKTDERS